MKAVRPTARPQRLWIKVLYIITLRWHYCVKLKAKKPLNIVDDKVKLYNIKYTKSKGRNASHISHIHKRLHHCMGCSLVHPEIQLKTAVHLSSCPAISGETKVNDCKKSTKRRILSATYCNA